MTPPYEDIETQLSFGRERLDGTRERKTIHPVAEEELDRYHLLGSGSGQSPGLAIFMGFRHCPDFYERVAGYRLTRDVGAEVLENVSGDHFGSIEFYELRTPDESGACPYSSNS